MLPTLPTKRVVWRRSYRILPARYPPIALFERVADPADWDALAEIESLTNARIRDEIGDVRLVPVDQRVSGPGASWVMGAFTHVGWPSRFSDGTHGVYYTAHTRDCAVAETAYHLGRFLAATSQPTCDIDMRVLLGGVDGILHDLRAPKRQHTAIFDLVDYTASQALAAKLRAAGSAGIVYRSVRLPLSECVAALRPRIIRPLPRGDSHLLYHWSGASIDRYWDYEAGVWFARH